MSVAISQGIPKYFKGRKLKSLAPPWSLVRDKTMHKYEWVKHYYELVLNKLSIDKIVNYLGEGAILLCWEKSSEFCHRFIVAEWLRKAGHNVEEIIVKFQTEKKDSAPIISGHDMTGLNNAQCEIVKIYEIYSTYPGFHNQAKKILAEIHKKFELLSKSEKSGVLKILNGVL